MSRYILYKKEHHQPMAFIDYEKITDIKLYSVTSFDCTDSSISSYEFIADIYAKWDACTHWDFYGEDYDGEDENKDSYYHICGPYCLERMFLAMTFAWEICRRIHLNIAKEEGYASEHYDSHYKASDKINKMIEKMLEDFEIEETEITEIPNIKY